MDIVKTATGKLFESDYISQIPMPDQVYLRICGSSLPPLAQVFADPSETIQLWYNDKYLAQYTRLVALIPEDGAVKVILAKE